MTTLADSWRTSVVDVIASPEYSTLHRATECNPAMCLASLLFTGGLVFNNSVFTNSDDAATVCVRSAFALAPHARTLTDESSYDMVRKAYVLGVRTYQTSFLPTSTKYPVKDVCTAIINACDLLAESEWKLPGQGVDDGSLGTTIKAIEGGVRAHITSVAHAWMARKNQWIDLSVTDFLKMPVDKRDRIEASLNGTKSANFMACTRTMVTCSRNLTVALQTQADLISIVDLDDAAQAKTNDRVTLALEDSAAAQTALDDLETRYHAAVANLKNATARVDKWTTQADNLRTQSARAEEEKAAMSAKVRATAAILVEQIRSHVDLVASEMP